MAESKQNKHLEHLEDDIINLGYKGAIRSISFIEALHDLFKGNSSQKIDLTVKWDGAPAIVAGTDPSTGLFFVATKHGAFAKTPKLNYTEKLIDYNHEGGLADVLKTVYRELKPLGIKNVMQGDVMFTEDRKEKRTINGKKYLTFKPNTIMYAVPEGDPLYETIDAANVGIVFHTTYTGSEEVNQMSASFNVNLSGLKKSKTAWIRDASYNDMSGKMTMTAQESRNVSSKLTLIKRNAETAKNFLNELAEQKKDLTVGYMFKIYVNKLIREGKTVNQRNLSQGLNDFIVERFSKKEAGVKTVKTREKYRGLLLEVQNYLKKNDIALKSMYTIYEEMSVLKNIFVDKLNEAQGIPTFVETEEGFRHTDPEGYVAIDREGAAVKLVNRLEFSKANFNAVKEWKGPPKAPEEPTQKLKTMVFAYGRMNPPTIGHQKLVNKVLSLARQESADHTIVLSKTQKPPKDPLDPDVKLAYAKKMFPNVNIMIATKELNTFFDWLKSWDGKYDRIIMVAGSDRVSVYTANTSKYQGDLYTFKIFDVVSAGERDPDSDGASGMSASKMRKFAEEDDFDNFKKGLPPRITKAEAEKLMALVKAGMKK